MAKAEFNKKKNLFTSKLDLGYKDSCVLTYLPLHNCIKHNGDDAPEQFDCVHHHLACPWSL